MKKKDNMEYEKDIFDIMVDKPYIFLMVGAVAIYLGQIRILRGNAILHALNYVMIVMGVLYLIFSILFTIIKIDERKNPMDKDFDDPIKFHVRESEGK